MDLPVCAECKQQFEPRGGRGRQSPYCENCKPKIRRRKAAQRQLRHSIVQVIEWVDVLAPEIIKRKEVLSDEQNGRCWRCNKRRKLYMTLDADGRIRGVCINHFGGLT